MRASILRVVSLILAGAVWSHTASAQFPLPPVPFSVPGGSNNNVAAAAAAVAVASIVVYIIEKHEASERQKEIADERARRAYANMSARRKAALKAKKVRYIAVTQKQEVASADVYDVKKSPEEGKTAKFDKYNAEYVGSGS